LSSPEKEVDMKDIVNILSTKFSIPPEKMEEYVKEMIDCIEQGKALPEHDAREMGKEVREAIINELSIFPIP
jgi:hypothetical protein